MRQLLQLMRLVWDGRIEAFSIANGEPRLKPPPGLVYELRVSAPSAPTGKGQRGDFALKAPVQDLFALFTRLGTARIEWLDVRGGLPVRVRVIAREQDYE
jgi:hypothetical protein